MATKHKYKRNVFVFSQASKRQLDTIHPDLQKVLKVTLQLGIMDFSVKEGHRSNARQLALQKQGKSQVGPGGSTHNTEPSWAVDVAPFFPSRSPSWNDFAYLAGMIQAVGVMLHVGLRWGGNWDQDAEILSDQNFDDGYHFELTEAAESDFPFPTITIGV